MMAQTKILYFFILTLVWGSLSCQQFDNPIILDSNWHLIDDESFSKINENNFYDLLKNIQPHNMKEIKIPGRLHQQNLTTRGGYYYLFKKILYDGGIEFPAIYLGEIKSIDQTYLNGRLIGRTGNMPPNIKQAYDRSRVYAFDHALLQKENWLLIKAYEPPGQGRAGIKATQIYLDSAQSIQKKQEWLNLLIMMCVSCILLISCYFWIIFKNYTFLQEVQFLALTGISLGLYLFFYSPIKYFISDNFLLLKKLEYVFLIIIPYFYLRFVLTSLKKNLRKLSYFFALLCLSSLIYVVLSPNEESLLNILPLWQWVILTQLLLAFAFHIYIWDLKLIETKFYAIGYCIIFGIALFDILGTWHWHHYPKILPFGIFIGLLVAALGLADKLKKINRSVIQQYAHLIYFTEHDYNRKEIKGIIDDYFNLLFVRLFIKNIAIEYCSEKEQHQISNSPTLLSEGRKLLDLDLNNIMVDEKNFSSNLSTFMKPFLKKNQKLFFLPLNINGNRKGFLCGIIYIIKQNKSFQNLLYLLQIQLEANIGRKEFEGQLNHLNQNLSQTIEQKTSLIKNKNKKLTQLNEVTNKIFTNVTHDIKTPLSLVTIPLELLIERSKNLNQKQLELLHKIKYNTFQTIERINNLLDWAKSEAKKIQFNPDYILVSDFFHYWYREFCLPLQEKKWIQFYCTLSEVRSLIDREKLEKIMVNLLSNALKYGQNDKPIQIKISISATQYTIEFQNYGNLINEEEIKNVFKRYKQITDKKGMYVTGSGLGLSIVAEFTQLHGGTVTASSSVSDGNKFLLSFPVLTSEKKQTLNLNNTTYTLTNQLAEMISSRNKNLQNLKIITPLVCINEKSEDASLLDLHLNLNIKQINLNDVELYNSFWKKIKQGREQVIIILNLESADRKSIKPILQKLPDFKKLFVPAILLSQNLKWQDYGFLKTHYFDYILKKPFYQGELLQVLQIISAQDKLRDLLKEKTIREKQR